MDIDDHVVPCKRYTGIRSDDAACANELGRYL
jgi:hypothetical protein